MYVCMYVCMNVCMYVWIYIKRWSSYGSKASVSFRSERCSRRFPIALKLWLFPDEISLLTIVSYQEKYTHTYSHTYIHTYIDPKKSMYRKKITNLESGVEGQDGGAQNISGKDSRTIFRSALDSSSTSLGNPQASAIMIPNNHTYIHRYKHIHIKIDIYIHNLLLTISTLHIAWSTADLMQIFYSI